ncbi:GfV-B52-ORF1 [Ichnoviriform fumiferanae]|uniref:GfV-B52-ORF1 n=1 Tax=Ichnoviriform fumiferanae TaxID=419435 RepID=A2PZU8_9VIRU|nr:GfV-B52-ORF1 [Ichnoviriform fumiferanae]BAF45520.1 GfV-B52-ORF1 [Ichnoviriform fumiferanae]
MKRHQPTNAELNEIYGLVVKIEENNKYLEHYKSTSRAGTRTIQTKIFRKIIKNRTLMKKLRMKIETLTYCPLCVLSVLK